MRPLTVCLTKTVRLDWSTRKDWKVFLIKVNWRKKNPFQILVVCEPFAWDGFIRERERELFICEGRSKCTYYFFQKNVLIWKATLIDGSYLNGKHYIMKHYQLEESVNNESKVVSQYSADQMTTRFCLALRNRIQKMVLLNSISVF